MGKRIAFGLAVLLATGWVVLSVVVELEGKYVVENLGAGAGGARALVLYHPSLDARFSDDLSRAFAEGVLAAGLGVDRATITSETPAHPAGYALVAVVTNTYYWTPDLPTLNYLSRADFSGLPVIGIVGGAGSTGRSQRLLEDALHRTGAASIRTRAYWLWRPNDRARLHANNRRLALEFARELGLETGMQTLKAHSPIP